MSFDFDTAIHALGFAIALVTLPGTVLLLALSLASLRSARRVAPVRRTGHAVIVVPAHDEAAGIGATVANLREETKRDGRCDIVVVADNCSDATADRARAAGASVLVRQDASRRGKGHALHHAFEHLRAQGYDFFVVIDADSRVAPGFLRALRAAFDGGALAVQARYTVLNAADSARTRLMAIALAAFNVLRPRGRAALGLSAGICGNGFALHRDALRTAPFLARSVTEDLEYHLQLVRAGVRVEFADSATVLGEMPAAGRGVRTQRERWEGGRLRLAVRRMPGLALGVLRGRWRELELLADLALAPLAYHALLLTALVALPAPWIYAGATGLAVLMLHVAVACRIAGIGAREAASALAFVPAYALWKLAVLPRILHSGRRQMPWVRTARVAK